MRASRTRVTAALTLVAVLTLGCSSQARERGTARTPEPLPPATGPERTGTPQVGVPRVGKIRTLAEGLEVPWDIAFLPDGAALVTERDSARLRRVAPDGKVSTVGKVSGVRPGGEGGLMGVAVAPDYDRSKEIFLYFTAESDNRIVRYRYEGDLSRDKVIVKDIPKGMFHNGGRITFGPDGHLYATTGDAGDGSQSQRKGSLGGKILRMDRDGKPVPGSPFGSLVWSYGHRNVQGLAWDESDRLYATEFGQDTYDEINRIRKGRNYGWPEIEGAGGGGRFEEPLLTWEPAEASPSGAAYAGGSLWVAALRGQRLWQVPLDGDGAAGRPIPHFEDEHGRLRGVATAPDGSLWVSTSNRDGRGSPRDGDDRILVIPPR